MTTIQIERLTVGTLVGLPSYDAVEVYEVAFDGEGYEVRFPSGNRGWDDLDSVYIPAGGSVEYAGRGTPSLRSDTEINRAEWEAKTAACDLAIAASIAELNRRAKLFGSVARALDSVREGSDYQMEVVS
jgi:hypothetical protein